MCITLQQLLLVHLVDLLLAGLREGLLHLRILLKTGFALSKMHGHLLVRGELAHDDGVGILSRATTDEVILLHTVSQQIEILSLRFLLRLVLLAEVEAFFLLLEGLVTHLLEALPTPVDHIDRPVLVVRLIRGDRPLVSGGLSARTLQ